MIQKIIFKDEKLIPIEGIQRGWEPPTKVNDAGYILVYHPIKKIWISVHKVVDEYYRGPRLNTECVHHKNFIKEDNRIENLQRMDKQEHWNYHSKGGKQHPMYGKRGNDSPNYGKKRTPEQCARIVESRKEIIKTPEYKAKISKSNTGKKRSTEVKKEMSEMLKKRWEDPEYREKMTEIRRNRPLPSDETKEKMRISALNKPPRTQEHKDNLSKAIKGTKHSEERKVNRSKNQKKMWDDPEYRERQIRLIKNGKDNDKCNAKISETLKKKWEDPKFRKKQLKIIKGRKKRQKNRRGKSV